MHFRIKPLSIWAVELRTPGARSRLLSTALVAVLAAAACGGSATKQAQASPSPSPSAVSHPTWTSLDKQAVGFTIQVPPRWDEASSSTINKLLQNNPNVPSDMQTQLRSALANDAIKLYVLDFDADASDQRFVTNFNVIEQSIPSGTTLQIYADANANQLQHLSAFHPPLDQANVALPAGKAVRMHYSLDLSTLRADVTQFVFVHGASAYILTFTTLPDRLDKVQSTFQSIAETLRFTG